MFDPFNILIRDECFGGPLNAVVRLEGLPLSGRRGLVIGFANRFGKLTCAWTRGIAAIVRKAMVVRFTSSVSQPMIWQ